MPYTLKFIEYSSPKKKKKKKKKKKERKKEEEGSLSRRSQLIYIYI